MDNNLDKLMGDTKIKLSQLISRSFSYVKPELKSFVLAFLFLILNIGFIIINPLFYGIITNELVKDNINFRYIVFMAFTLMTTGLLAQAFYYLEAKIITSSGQRIVYRIRSEVYRHIQKLSLSQLSLMPIGSLVTRVCSYTSDLSNLFTSVILRILKNLLTLIGVMVIMFYLSVQLSLTLSMIMIIVFIITFFFSKYIRKLFKNESRAHSNLNSFLSENLSGMKITQLFNQEGRKYDEFHEKNLDVYNNKKKILISFSLYRTFISNLHNITVLVCFFRAIQLKLDPGQVLAFYFFISYFFNPIQELSDQLNQLQKAFSSIERLLNLLDVKPQIEDEIDAIDINKISGKIEFKNVWFAYNDNNWILKDVSFTIDPKTSCAFIGPTGAGKTTILSLIVRNYKPNKGQILIDGIDINTIKIESLRKLIGQMLQDVFIFSGSVKDNITLFEEDSNVDEVVNACKYVNANSFIDKFENGLEQTLNQGGSNLSSGQRQLLSFARVVYHKPQLLILDEATSNIDTQTELLIQKSLENMKNIGTMLIVAHRLSTIQHCDQIIVIKDGIIIEKGNHHELMMKHGYYYNINK